MTLKVTGIETIELEDPRSLNKAQFRKVLKGESFKWADGLEGKPVRVFWFDMQTQSRCKARGYSL